MLNVLIIIGTRPEAIKMAPVIKKLKSRKDIINTTVCTTAQHREMLDQVLEVFNIKPEIDLNLMQDNQKLVDITGTIIKRIDEIISKIKPDMLLVQGDTTTVMCASLAAFYNKINIGHVEAGLRTNNIYFPFPEEINRRITSVVTTYHFAPTNKAQESLLKEGIPHENIFVTGNTVIDALKMVIDMPIPITLKNILSDKTFKKNNKIILVTAHRRENIGEPLKEICKGLEKIIKRNEDVSIIYPVHMNPKVSNYVYENLSNIQNIHLIRPLEYDSMAHLMSASYLILTDSGGIQEEAPSLGKPVLVLRNETERPEALDIGATKLIGTDADTILNEVEELLHNKNLYKMMSKGCNPYGDGNAADRILNILINID